MDDTGQAADDRNQDRDGGAVMGFRRAAKKDINHKQIVRELRALGFRVDDVAQLKKLYDLVVTGKVFGSQEVRTIRVEVKSEGGTLTYDEQEYHRAEPYPETLVIAYKTEDILEWFHHSYLTKPNLSEDAVLPVSADAVKKDTTRITLSSTTSRKAAKRNTKNSTTPAISS